MKKIFTIFVLLLSNHSSFCQWSTNPSINNAICTDYYNQSEIQMIRDGSGGAIISWIDSRFQPAYTIFAQRINSSGILQWTTNGIQISPSSSTTGQQSIISDGNGGAIITWHSGGQAGSIYVQHVNSGGVLQWGASGVVICSGTAGDFDGKPSVTIDGNGGAIIAWSDNRTGSLINDLYVQRVNAAGVVQWAVNGVVVSSASEFQGPSQITSDGSGGAIIVWQDNRSTTTSEIYIQKVNGAGAMQWVTDGVLVNSVPGGSLYPQLINDAGGAIICWADRRLGNSDWNIYAQKVSALGIVQWMGNGVPASLAVGNENDPQLTLDGTGGAIITWDVPNSATNTAPDIYAQRLNSSGTTQWGLNGVAVCQAANSQHFPQLTSDGNGGTVITWQDNRTSNIPDIYAQRINSSGSALWTNNGVAVSTATFVQNYPIILNDGINGMIISWTDFRNDLGAQRNDIYAQRLNADGTLGSSALCAKPIGLTAVNITSSSATIRWNSVSGAAKYNLQGRKQGTATWLSIKVIDTSYHATGLMAATTYEYRVQTYCTSDGSFKSAFTVVKIFTTAAAPLLSKSLQESVQSSPVEIYPNPANDFICINYSGKKEMVIASIYDPVGKLVKQETRRNELSFKLDVKLLKPGMYIINLSDGSTIEKGKFVKQ